jgi:energy-coupling factor transporter ATP-binding protein EcfA2
VYLAFTSRLLSEPVSIFAQGPSSSGKTFIGKVVAGLMPEESARDVQGISPQALHYMDDRLKHTIVLMGEWARDEDQTDDGIKTAALRQLISDGRLSKLVTNTENGRPTTEQADTEGPVTVYATSTLPMSRIFEEDENRFLIVHTNESPEATRLVMERKARDAAGQGDNPEALDRIVRRHHAMQREIARRAADVVIPFAVDLVGKFPSDQPRRRRDMTKVLGMVQACALLHHRQRQRDADNRIVASIEDYKIIHELLTPFMVKEAVTPAAINKMRELADKIREKGGKSPWPVNFKRVDTEKFWNVGKARASELIKELLEAGMLETAPGLEWTYQITPGFSIDTPARSTFLPPPPAQKPRTHPLVSEAAKLFNAKTVSEVSL